ncbi:BCCT family transporter [Schaalia sp. 19OD2882]|nr:BCCT family transporter [Schaalia sp. 19OD2882]
MAELSTRQVAGPVWGGDQGGATDTGLARSERSAEFAGDGIGTEGVGALADGADAEGVGALADGADADGVGALSDDSSGFDAMAVPVESQDPPRRLRIFWAAVTGVLTLAMLLAGGIPVLQAATVVMALPFSFVVIAVAVGLVKELRKQEG